jgi:hypothetical protein
MVKKLSHKSHKSLNQINQSVARDCQPEPHHDVAGLQINTLRCGIPAYQYYTVHSVLLLFLV